MDDRPALATNREASIVEAFIHLADTLVEDYDVIDFLHFLIGRCVELVDIDEAAIMVAAPSGHLQAVASSSERGHLLELFELQNEDGPCLDAYRSGAVVTSQDLAGDEQRWPTFAPQAISVGFHAVHSVPLRLRNEVVGALNLLRFDTGELAAVDARLVRALSDIATVGLLQERTISQARSASSGLQFTLLSRVRIEQAKGILAERANLSVDEAFDILRNHARRNQIGLTAAAAGIVDRTLDIGAFPGQAE